MQIFRRTRATVALAFAAAITVAGCGSDSPTEPTVFGTYSVQSVNGNGLPYSQSDGGITVTFISGTVVLNSNHTYTTAFNLSATTGGLTIPSTETSSGTFSVTGAIITFVDAEDSSQTVGAVDGNTITVTQDGEVLVIRK